MLKVWGRRNSNNVQKVLWLCEEIGLEYDHEDAGGEFGRTRDPDMLARNPNAVVPTIEDDGFVLWESNVILRYLASKYGPEEIYPVALTSRADVERWMDWQQTTLAPEMRTVFWGLIRTPARERNHGAIEKSVENLKSIWIHLDQHLRDQPFVAGDRLTIGDIPVGAMCYRYYALDIDHAHLEHLVSWYKRLKTRKAFSQHVMLPLT